MGAAPARESAAARRDRVRERADRQRQRPSTDLERAEAGAGVCVTVRWDVYVNVDVCELCDLCVIGVW